LLPKALWPSFVVGSVIVHWLVIIHGEVIRTHYSPVLFLIGFTAVFLLPLTPEVSLSIAVFHLLAIGYATRFPTSAARWVRPKIRLRPWEFGTLLFLSTVTFHGLLSYPLFGHTSLSFEEAGEHFYAKVFAAGKSDAAPHALSDAFEQPPTPTGWRWIRTAALALGFRIGTPWLIDPLILAFLCLFIYGVARKIYHEPAGRIFALIGLLFISITFELPKVVDTLADTERWRNLSTVDDMVKEEPDLKAVFFVPIAEYPSVVARVNPFFEGPLVFAKYLSREQALAVCHYYEDYQHFYLSGGEAVGLPCPVQENVTP